MDNKGRHDEDHTDSQRARRACRRHLNDLIRAHGCAPDDIRLRSQSVPRRIDPTPPSSYCTSPADLCLEIGE